MKNILKLILIFLGVTVCFAQKRFQVQGSVVDFHDKTALSGTKIQLGGHTAVAGSTGRFRFDNISAGTYTVTATHPDCRPFSQVVSVDKDLDLRLLLEHHSADIETVALHGTRKNSGVMIVESLSKAEISRNSTENLGNVLSNISGVGTLKTGNNIAKPIIHGLYGSRITIINSGVRMAEQEWGVEHSPSIEPSAFEKIHVVKGSGVLKYSGDAIGGVVVLEPENFPAKDTLMGYLSASGISNGKGAKITADISKIWENKWFVKTVGAYKKLGDLSIPGHTLQNTGTEEQSFNFAFGNRSFLQGFEVNYSGINQNFGIFKGSHLGGPEDFYNVINSGQSLYLDDFSYAIQNPKQEVSHHIASAEAYKRFHNWGKFTLKYAFQINNRKEYDIRRGDLNALPSMDLRLMTQNVKLEHLLEREKWKLESGIVGGYQDNYPDPATKARRLIPDYYKYDAGVFSVFQYRFAPKWRGEAGIRYDFSRYDAYKYYDQVDWDRRFADLFPQFVVKTGDSRVLTHPVFDFHNISANVGVNYTPSDRLDFKLNFSKADRTPNAAELFADGLHHSAAIIETGNLAIKKEEVYHINLSAKTNLNFLAGLTIQANPYLIFSENFVNQIPNGVQSTNRGVFMKWDYVQTKARLLGIDADAELHITNRLKWTSQFNALRGDDLGSNEPLILMLPTNFRNAVEYNFLHAKNFYVKLENETFLNQNRFPNRNQDVMLIEDGKIVTKTLDTSSTPDGYSVLHASLGGDLFKNLNFNLRVNNLFNTEYRDYLNRLRYFAPELGRNVILTLKLKF